jgi:hypothetical protein
VCLGCTVQQGEIERLDSPECSPCRALDREACYEDPTCEAVPYWGESVVACQFDERGFSQCLWLGCREAGMAAECPSLEEMVEACAPDVCGYNAFNIDERGCRTCECGVENPVAECAHQ